MPVAIRWVGCHFLQKFTRSLLNCLKRDGRCPLNLQFRRRTMAGPSMARRDSQTAAGTPISPQAHSKLPPILVPARLPTITTFNRDRPGIGESLPSATHTASPVRAGTEISATEPLSESLV